MHGKKTGRLNWLWTSIYPVLCHSERSDYRLLGDSAIRDCYPEAWRRKNLFFLCLLIFYHVLCHSERSEESIFYVFSRLE